MHRDWGRCPDLAFRTTLAPSRTTFLNQHFPLSVPGPAARGPHGSSHRGPSQHFNSWHSGPLSLAMCCLRSHLRWIPSHRNPFLLWNTFAFTSVTSLTLFFHPVSPCYFLCCYSFPKAQALFLPGAFVGYFGAYLPCSSEFLSGGHKDYREAWCRRLWNPKAAT